MKSIIERVGKGCRASIVESIALEDVAEQVLDCKDLEEWGRYIRAEKSPVPKDAPKMSFIGTMVSSCRDEDDEVRTDEFNPEKCWKILEVVSTATEKRQVALYAYYCDSCRGSIEKCRKKLKVSRRGFSQTLKGAQRFVKEELEK